MDYARLETANLADVDNTYYYGADCRSCLRSRRISLVRLRTTLGDHFPLKDIRPRLKCATCGSRQIIVTFLSPNQAVANLARLFDETPVWRSASGQRLVPSARGSLIALHLRHFDWARFFHALTAQVFRYHPFSHLPEDSKHEAYP